VDVAINNVNDLPDLYRLDPAGERRWVALRLVGTRSNRDAIGARVRVMTRDGSQWQEVRSGGSYYSQNDLRLHFGLGDAQAIERVEVRWPNGQEEAWMDLAINRYHTLTEGSGQPITASNRKN
jgi:enediyne biosynthesis protein E4